jgi:hypothetical protein
MVRLICVCVCVCVRSFYGFRLYLCVFHVSAKYIIYVGNTITLPFVPIISTSRIDFKTKENVMTSVLLYFYYDCPFVASACLTCINKLLVLSVVLIAGCFDVTLECSYGVHTVADKYPPGLLICSKCK